MSTKATDLDDIIEAIQSLATLMDQRFDAVDVRFDRLEGRVDKVEDKLDSIDNRLSNVEKEQAVMRISINKLDNRLSGVESDIYEIYDRLTRRKSRA